jgi:solute carrier family 25 citrate transporter 1
MDTVKIKLIHDRLTKNKYKGTFDGMKKIVAKEGFGGIYTGIGPTLVKFSMNQGIRFMIYDTIMGQIEKVKSIPIHAKRAVCGGLAGAVSVIANQPVDVIKTNMQGLHAHKYKSSIDCFKQTMKHEGMRGLYKGTLPRITRVTNTVAITFVLLEGVRDALWKMFPDPVEKADKH